MILRKKELLALIQEEVKRQQKKLIINKKIQDLQEQVKKIENSSDILKEIILEDASAGLQTMPSPALTDTGGIQPTVGTTQHSNFYEEPEAGKAEKEYNLYSLPTGKILVINFEGDRMIKLISLANDEFEVYGLRKLREVKKGDRLKCNDSGVVKKGRQMEFEFVPSNRPGYRTPTIFNWQPLR